MKHAGEEAVGRLEPLLKAVRRLPGLTERKRGVFYRKSNAFLHFHEDPAGLFADVRFGTGWKRYRITTLAERSAFVRTLKRYV